MRRKSILYLLILSILLVYILPLYSSFAQDKGQERLKIDFSQFIEDGIEDKAGENLTIKAGEKKALLMEKFFFYKEMFRDKPIYIIAGEEKSTHRMGQDLTLDLELERGEYLLVLEKKDYDLLEEDYVFEFIVKDEGENTIYPRLALSPEQKEALEEKLSLVEFLFSNLIIDDDLRLVLENDFDKKDFSLGELSNKKFLLPDGSYKISVEEKAIDYLEEDHVFDFTIEKTLEDKEKSFLIELDNIKDKPACFDQEKEDKKPAGNQKDLSYLTIDFSLALDKGKKTLLTRDKLSEKEDLGFDDKLIGTKFMVETKEGEEAYILGKDLKIVMEKPGGKIKIKVFKKDLDLLSKDFIYEIDLDERDDKDLYLYIGMDDFLKTEKDLEKPAPNPSLRNKNLADEHMEINIYYPGEKDQAFKRFSQGEPIKIEVLAKIKNFNDRDMRNVKRLQIGYRTINNVFQKLSVEYKNLGDKDYKKFNNLDEIYYGDFVNLSEEEREAILKEKKFNHFSNNSRSYIQFSTDLFKDNRVSNNFEIKLTYYLHKHFYYSDDLTNNKGTISPYGYIYEARQWQEGEYNIHSYTEQTKEEIDTRTYKGTVQLAYIGEIRQEYRYMYENMGRPEQTYFIKRKSPINGQEEYLYRYDCVQCTKGRIHFRYYWCPSNKEKISLSERDMGHDYKRNQDNMQELKKEEIKISGKSFSFIKWINDNSAVLEAKTRIDHRPFFSRHDNEIEYSCCYMDNVNNYLKTYIKGNIDFTKSNLEDDESVNFTLYSKNEKVLPDGSKIDAGIYPDEVSFVDYNRDKTTPIRVVWTRIDKEKDRYDYKTSIRLDGRKYYYTDEKLTGDPNIIGLYRLIYDLDEGTNYRLSMEKKEGYLKNEDKEFSLSKANPEYVYDDFFALEGRINVRLYLNEKKRPLAGEEAKLIWSLDNGSLPNGEEITRSLEDKLNYNNLEWILSKDGNAYYILLKSDSEGQLTYKDSKDFYLYYDKNKSSNYSLSFNRTMEGGRNSLDISFSKNSYIFNKDIVFKNLRLPQTGSMGQGVFIVGGALMLIVSLYGIYKIKNDL